MSFNSNFNAVKLSVEAVHPNNTVLFDDRGLPSVMVRIPKLKMSDLIEGGSEAVHPAFIVGGVEVDEIFISKYQNIVIDGRAYSLPMQDPKTYINYETANKVCEDKGEGWHLMSNAEWSLVALLSKKLGTMPRGNNNCGASAERPYEKGVARHKYTHQGKEITGRVATGSGGASWSHDGTDAGIFDLNGNVWEWVAGFRLVDGELQVILNNDVAMGGMYSANSTKWKAIAENGSLVAPNTAGTLKYDYVSKDTNGSNIRLVKNLQNKQSSGDFYAYNPIKNMEVEDELTPPIMLKALGLYPVDSNLENDRIYMRNVGERLPLRGGSWGAGIDSGVFALLLKYARSISYRSVGFRSAYIKVRSEN